MLRGTGGWNKPLNNHEVLATEREPEGPAQRSNHEVLATEREPEGQAQSAQQFMQLCAMIIFIDSIEAVIAPNCTHC